MIRTHLLPAAYFEELAAGTGGPDIVRLLKQSELSRRLLQLRALHDYGDDATRRSYNLLRDIQRHAPNTVSDILLYPHVGAWAASCLRRLRASAGIDSALKVDLAYLDCVAAVAAIKANLDITVTVPVRRGSIVLPSLGRALVGPDTVNGTGVVRHRDGATEVVVAGHAVDLPGDTESDGPHWQPLRRVQVAHEDSVLDICIDDLDPFRDCSRLGAASRLSKAEMAAWRRTIEGAWRILVRHHPERAQALMTGLTAIVPLTERGSRGVSATAVDTFGAVAMSPPADSLRLAESLVHEFQHAKLGALLRLTPLHEARSEERHYAPWRDDPRPLGGLLQGTYAYLGVTDFWRCQLAISGDDFFSEFQFALWREQTWKATDSLHESGQLTSRGVQFVDGMRAALARWREAPVRAEARELAWGAASDHKLVWRLRHVRLEPDAVDRLATNWLGGGPCPQIELPSIVSEAAGSKEALPRMDLRFHLARTQAYERKHTDTGTSDLATNTNIEGATSGDHSCVQFSYLEAMKSYCSQLAREPDSVEGWAGLALALSRTEPGPAAEMLCARPEVIVAVHRRVRDLAGAAPNPVKLAEWLGTLSYGGVG